MDAPQFIPKPGQADLTLVRYCPVVNCVVQYGEKFLIVKRSGKMRLYPEYWNGISGFLDDNRSIEAKAREELGEELGIGAEDIILIRMGEIFEQEAPEYEKTWIVHPVLAVVNTDSIRLDWEATEYEWIMSDELIHYKLMPGFDTVVTQVMKLM